MSVETKHAIHSVLFSSVGSLMFIFFMKCEPLIIYNIVMIIGLQRQLSESSLPPCDFFSFLAPV